MILELPAPGMQDTGETRQISTDETRILRKAFAGSSRRFEHGLVGDALVRPEKRSYGVRDGEGDEEVWTGELFVQLVV